MNCLNIRAALIHRMSDNIEVSMVQGQCVFTLPIKSLDDRLTDVFIEKQLGNIYHVHDAGITTAQLFAQGIHITELKAKLFEEMARRLGVAYTGGTFEVSCQETELQDAILAVGQCAAIATYEVAAHKPIIEEEPIKTRVQRSLDRWKPNYVRQINRNVIVKGHKADHSFDFVSFPEDPSANTVAIQILAPSHSPQAQAERYGFLVLDVEGKPPYEMWRRFAIITKAENWGEKPLTLVRALSQQTATLKTGDEEAVERLIPPIMESLSKAA